MAHCYRILLPSSITQFRHHFWKRCCRPRPRTSALRLKAAISAQGRRWRKQLEPTTSVNIIALYSIQWWAAQIYRRIVLTYLVRSVICTLCMISGLDQHPLKYISTACSAITLCVPYVPHRIAALWFRETSSMEYFSWITILRFLLITVPYL